MKLNTRFLLFRVISPLIASLAVFLVAGLRFAEPVWLSEHSVFLMASMMGGAYLIGHVFLLSPIARSKQISLHIVRVIAVGALVSLPVFLYFLMMDIDVSRMVIVYEIGILFFLLATNSFSSRPGLAILVNVGVLVIIVIASLPGMSQISAMTGKKIEFDSAVSYEFANYHDIKITKYKVFKDKELANGGSIETIDDTRLLLVTGYGKLYLIDTKGGKINIQKLDIRVPINADTYLTEAKNPNLYFRVTDIILEESESDVRKLYVAHHYFDTVNQCYTLRLSETQFDLQNLKAGEWLTRYDSQPCVKINKFPNLTGGRLAFTRDGNILLTVGVHSYSTREFADLDGSHYGRVIQINPTDWTARVFSKGHRNPQGLYVGSDKIWSTEHGPEGGDELNELEYGSDYGWPFSSFGTDYGKKTFEGGDPGKYLQGRLPFYAWVPSIGISNLVEVKGTEFSAWQDDLLVTSLNGMSIFRVRIRENRVVTIERLKLGERIRDIVELPSGKIMLWNGEDTLQFLESANYVFSECKGCHVLSTAGRSIGPGLRGIVGRKVADSGGYAYSKAMLDFGGTWTPERLDVFLANPAQTVPGTSMQVEGISDPARRKEIIQFLQGVQDYDVDKRR